MKTLLSVMLFAAFAWGQCGKLVYNPFTRTMDCSGTNSLPDYAAISDYGAKCDNVTNDTVALQAAINSGAAVVLFDLPVGSYFCRFSNLTIPPSTSLEGLNHRTTYLRAIAGSTGVAIQDNGNATGITIRNLSIDGFGVAYTDILKLGRNATPAGGNGTLENVAITTTATTGNCLSVLVNMWQASNINTYGCAKGMYLGGTGLYLEGIQATHTATVGIDIDAGSSVTLVNAEVEAPATGSIPFRFDYGPMKLIHPICSFATGTTVTDCINITSIPANRVGIQILGINVYDASGTATWTNKLAFGVTPVIAAASTEDTYLSSVNVAALTGTTVVPSGASIAPTSATAGVVSANQINGTALAGLATGILKNTTTTGALSISTYDGSYSVEYFPGMCASGEASAGFNAITANAPTYVCNNAGTTASLLAVFGPQPATQQCIQFSHLTLPAWTGRVDIDVDWRGESASANTVTWQVQNVAVEAAATIDSPAFGMLASWTATAPSGTKGRVVSSKASVPIQGTCTAGTCRIYWNFCRSQSDTFVDNADLLGLRFMVYRSF